MKSYAVALAALCLSFLTQGAIAKDPELLSLGAEHFKDTASVTEDPAAGSTTISTERRFVDHWGPLRMTWNDEFLKSVIDHKTGTKSFEIDVAITYSGNGRSYKTASYQSPQGPRSVPLTLVRKDSMNCATGECMYTERLAFPVEEPLLRQVAAAYVPGKPALWTFQLPAKGGPDYRGQFSTAEIAGLLARVDAYGEAPPPLAPPPLAPPPLPLAFGISGLAVSPSAELPERAGVLVAELHGGSVAHKAGILTGDIIYRFDASPIKSLPELQAAVAGKTANSTAVIHLYRGTTAMELIAHF